jgi:hypothetical protein
MTVSGFWRGAKRRWRAWAAELWPATPAENTQEELARLDGELSLLYARLVGLSQRIDACRRRGDPERAARLEAIYQRQRERLERRKRLRRDLAAGRKVVMDVTFGR